MTTKNTIQLTTAGYLLPEPPPREPDEVTAFRYIYQPGSHQRLARRFGSPESTLVEYDLWIVASPESNRAQARRPDLLIAFDANPQLYNRQNGYIISEQGKPPDFVMEVASASTASNDTGVKRDEYAALGISEYWRFDSTGDDYGEKLAGEILDGETYRPLPVEEIAPKVLQGYSPALGLLICWNHGQLEWWDPKTESPIPSWEDADARAQNAEAETNMERETRLQTEARNQELEEENRRLRRQLGDADANQSSG